VGSIGRGRVGGLRGVRGLGGRCIVTLVVTMSVLVSSPSELYKHLRGLRPLF